MSDEINEPAPPTQRLDFTVDDQPNNVNLTGTTSPPPPDIDTREYNPEPGRDLARQMITFWLLGLLCSVVALAFVGLFVDARQGHDQALFQNLKTLLDVLIGPIVTLLSTAVGFYFGAQVHRSGTSTGGNGK